MAKQSGREILCPPNNEGCKYYPNCHLSQHHEMHRSYVKSMIAEHEGDEEYARLAKRVMNDPRLLVMSCRMIHDLLDMQPTKELPSTTGAMRSYLNAGETLNAPEPSAE
jgi:hypothetical protein